VSKSEAESECRRLANSHPDRGTHQWFPRRIEGDDWAVVKVELAPNKPLTPETRAEPKPATADDPRSAAMRDIGPNVGPV